MHPDKVSVLTSADPRGRSCYSQLHTVHKNVSQQWEATAMWTWLGILHSQKVLCSVKLKVSSVHENLHTNPTRNQTRIHTYEAPGFYPQHNQVPQCSYNTMLQVTSRPIMQ